MPPEPSPPADGRRPRVVVAVTLALFAARLASGLHGFSLPLWHAMIDDSRAPEVRLGQAQAIRADDWAVILPMILAQRAHRPAFPMVNRLIGDGQSMITHYAMPVLHPVTLFRPQVWGYFIGTDFGLAWHWGLLVTGLFLAWFWLLLLVAPGRTLLAGCGAGLLLATPFVQFWSLNNAPALAFTALWCRATIGFVVADRPRAAAGWALLATWSALGLFFCLYPPYAIPLALLGATIVVGWLWRAHARMPRPGLKAGLAVGSAVVTLIVLIGWWQDGREALRLVLATEYPGHRFATGGGYRVATLLQHEMLLPLWFTDWTRLGNICEAASTAFLFPLVGAAAVGAWSAGRTRPDPLGALLLAFVVTAAFWMIGVPHPALARWTPLHLVPSTRMLGALVPADVLLAVWFVAAGPAVRPGRRLRPLLLVGWAALLGWVAWQTHLTLPGARLRYVLPAGGAVLVAGALLLHQRWQAIAWLAALSGVATFGFNPVVHGGSRYLHDNSLSRRLLAIDRGWGGGTSWAVWNHSVLSNLPRALGLHSWNGVQVYPQERLWRTLDPEARQRPVWNRYASVIFALAPDADQISIASPQPDVVLVTIAPANPAFRALGVTHAIVEADANPPPAALAGLRPLGRIGRHRIYQLADGPRTRGPAP